MAEQNSDVAENGDKHKSDEQAEDDLLEWQREEVLREHLDAGDTYEDIASQYPDAGVFQIGEWVRNHSLTPLHNRPKFPDGDVPVRLIDGVDIEHPITDEIANKYGIEGGTPLRFNADPQGMDLSFIIEVGEHVTGDYSNERKATQRGTMHPTARYPRRIAHASGLADLFGGLDSDAAADTDDSEEQVEFTGGILGGGGEESNDGMFGDSSESEESDEDGRGEDDGPAVKASFEELDDSRFRVTYRPSPTPWTASTAGPTAPDGLTTMERALLPSWKDTAERARSQADVAFYQLTFPEADSDSGNWTDVYELLEAEEVSQHLGFFADENGETHFGVVISFNPDEETHPGLRTGVHISQKGVKGVNEQELPTIYPVKALLHTVGIGVVEHRRTIKPKIVPGDHWIGITDE